MSATHSTSSSASHFVFRPLIVAGLWASIVAVGCVKPGGAGGSGGSTSTGSGGGSNPGSGGSGSPGTGNNSGTGNSPGTGGAGNETVITSGGVNGSSGGGPAQDGGVASGGSGQGGMAAGTGGATVAKMTCTTPPANYPYAPGYQISATAVTMAQNAVSSMTATNRADELRGTNPGPSNSRNYSDTFRTLDVAGIKGFKFRDGPRGVNLLAENPAGGQGYSTTYPAAVARGATFDPTIEYQIGQAMGDEMVGSQHNMLLAPTTNILRHPLWGRAQETYGEDVFLLGRMGSANIVGIQEYVPACAKHYAANNIEQNRANLNAQMDEQTLQEVYARHFQMMIQDAGVSSLMAAYNSVNGVKSTQNGHLLNDLLRTQFGFQGFVLSDWWAMPDGGTTDQQKANAAQALKAGLDMELPWNYNYSQLEAQVSANAITSADVQAAALRVVREKYRFNIATGSGLKAATTSLSNANSITGNDAHIALAEKAALEGTVLLKNDNNTLPIVQTGRNVATVAVIGGKIPWSITGSGSTQSGTFDFVNDIRIGDLGSSRVQPDPAKTIGALAGIKAAAPSGITVTSSNDSSAANNADFIIVMAGLTQQDEGEEYTGESDRNSFGLDGKTKTNAQNTLISDVAAIATSRNKPMVVVLQGGAVIDMPWLSSVPAVVMAWYPGQHGGAAIGQLLFGKANFSGKLPVTWATTGWPTFNEGNTTTMSFYLGYRLFDKMNIKPVYPFGHGLSYTNYMYSNVTVPCNDVAKDANIPVNLDLFNMGSVDGDETVMIFVRYLDAPPSGMQRSIKELKAFRRVNLTKGQGKHVVIDLRASDLKVYDPTSKTLKVITGKVQILVGPSSDRTKLLPASDSDTSTVINVLP